MLTKYPLSWQQEPRCSKVVSLPYSMVGLDHVVGVAGREELPTGEQVAEAALKQVQFCSQQLLLLLLLSLQLFITTISGATGIKLSLNESAQWVTAALYQVHILRIPKIVCKLKNSSCHGF